MTAATPAQAPAVTAVVPTHDRPELMARAVRSVIDQAYAGDIEVLVVFDACEVMLPDVGPLPANRTLRGFGNARQRGLAGGRNTGILAARHELIAFLDDDDTWLPDKLVRQVAALSGHPSAVLTGTAMVVDDGRRTHVRRVPSDVVTRDALLQNRLAGLHSSSFLLRRTALLGDLGLVDEAIPRSYGEDYDLLLRAAALGPIPVVNEPLVRVTWQGRSHFLGHWATYADAWRFLLAKHPDFGASRRGLARMQAQIAFALAASGERGSGARWAVRSLRGAPGHLKAWLALAVAARLADPDLVARALRRFGRGL